jgi:hypothetical protein
MSGSGSPSQVDRAFAVCRCLLTGISQSNRVNALGLYWHCKLSEAISIWSRFVAELASSLRSSQ